MQNEDEEWKKELKKKKKPAPLVIMHIFKKEM